MGILNMSGIPGHARGKYYPPSDMGRRPMPVELEHAKIPAMTLLLAYAEGPDTTDSGLTISVIAMLIIAVATVLAAIPIATARRRRLGIVESVAALMVIWGLLTVGIGIYTVNDLMKASKNEMQISKAGYARVPRSPSEPWMWAAWGALAAIYAGGVIWSVKAKPFAPAAPPAGFEVIHPSPPAEPRD